ncbi:MAG: DUF1127 domain-containing protein [Burkholderiaceae bacterium]|nr:DUF1127 domain-containing protein [Burkholderiaceae bacterium]
MNLLFDLYQILLHAQRRRADAQALAQMDARELLDIGMGTGERDYWLARSADQRPQSRA